MLRPLNGWTESAQTELNQMRGSSNINEIRVSGYGQFGWGGKTIYYQRTTETDKSTTGTFSIPGTDIKGYFLESAGPSTTQSGLDRRIPAGTYNLSWHNGASYQGVLKLSNDQVPASRGILIHIGNYPSNTSGCLLPGSSLGIDFVGSSGKMLNQILNHYNSVGISGAQITIYDINYP